MSMGDIDWGKRNIGSTLGKRNVGSALRTYRSPYKRYESPGKMDAMGDSYLKANYYMAKPAGPTTLYQNGIGSA